jgi:SagB-type dehydrogenase family enzyme
VTAPDAAPPLSSALPLLRSFSYGEPAREIDMAEAFHEASKVAPDFAAGALGPAGRYLATTPGAHLALGRKALAHTGPRVQLPPAPPLAVDLTRVSCQRRSGLPDRAGPVPLVTLATVLALSAGRSPQRPGLRITPSAGGLYPLDVIVVAGAVESIAPGAYLYVPLAHALLPRTEVEPARFHTRAAGTGPLAPPQPAVTLAIVATFARTRAKYGLRGYRFALLEAGHLAQAAITVATALGLCTLPWGGFLDAEVDTMLEVDGVERSCVYLLGLSAAGPEQPT